MQSNSVKHRDLYKAQESVVPSLVVTHLGLLSNCSCTCSSLDYCSVSTARRQPRRVMSYLSEAQPQNDLSVKNLTMAAVNINSITSPGRLDELQYFVDANQVDILAVSEMKIDHTVHPCLFTLRNFHRPFIKPRTRRGGGVGIYINTSLPVTHANYLENDDFESVWVKIKIKNKYIFVCSSYLPPQTPADKQIQYLDYITDSVTKAYAHSPALVAIMGDQNAGNCWLPPGAPRHSAISSFERRLKSTTEALGLVQLSPLPRASKMARTTYET